MNRTQVPGVESIDQHRSPVGLHDKRLSGCPSVVVGQVRKWRRWWSGVAGKQEDETESLENRPCTALKSFAGRCTLQHAVAADHHVVQGTTDPVAHHRSGSQMCAHVRAMSVQRHQGPCFIAKHYKRTMGDAPIDDPPGLQFARSSYNVPCIRPCGQRRGGCSYICPWARWQPHVAHPLLRLNIAYRFVEHRIGSLRHDYRMTSR